MSINFKKCKFFVKTLEKYKNNPVIKKKVPEFIENKTKDPHGKFGASDYAFGNKGNLGGYYHAHLTSDISIVYRIEGNTLFLYAIGTHDELGTGQPANINKQKSLKQKLDNQIFEDKPIAQI